MTSDNKFMLKKMSLETSYSAGIPLIYSSILIPNDRIKISANSWFSNSIGQKISGALDEAYF